LGSRRGGETGPRQACGHGPRAEAVPPDTGTARDRGTGFGRELEAAYDAVLRAARSGTISLVDLKAASYARILKLKSRL
jgi:hypothetical protein